MVKSIYGCLFHLIKKFVIKGIEISRDPCIYKYVFKISFLFLKIEKSEGIRVVKGEEIFPWSFLTQILNKKVWVKSNQRNHPPSTLNGIKRFKIVI